MCGRFALTISPKVLKELFQLAETPQLPARYNIAPSQPVAAVVLSDDSTSRVLKMPQWGLLPAWAKDPASRFINARSETAGQKNTFKNAYKKRRCLIPADGFYEWQKKRTPKQPYFFRRCEAIPMALAGLWERWTGPNGLVIESCAILTTAGNELMKPIHDRMPVIIDPKDFELWLDTTQFRADSLRKLLQPYPSEKMTCYPVSPVVNSPENDLPGCLEPLPGQEKPEKGLFY